MFEAATCHDPRKPLLFRRVATREVWGIACADAHPSYEFVLTTTGEFRHAPTERFDVFIEQSACIWSFTDVPKFRGVPYPTLDDEEFIAKLSARETLVEVPEASDSFTRVRIDDAYLVFEDPETGDFKDAWER